jgi:hypothetical protein
MTLASELCPRESTGLTSNYWDGRAEELALKEQAGKGGRLNSGNARAYAQTLTERLDRRLRQLIEERDIQALPPQVKGAAFVVPRDGSAHASQRRH